MNGQEDSSRSGESYDFLQRDFLQLICITDLINRAQNIVKRYPCYNVRFEGICYGPEDTKRFGACSQMAIFERKEDPSTMGIDILGVEGFFETIDTIIYPYFADKRTDNEKVLDEAIYYVNFISSRNEDASDAVYLREVLMMMQKYSISLDVLKNLMRERGYIIEELDDGPVVILPEENNSDTDEIYIEDMEFDGELSLTDDEHEMEMYDMDEDVMIENGNWNESIVITQNQTAFVQENSYLYDGEPSIEQHRPSEELAADLNNDQFSRTNIAEGISEQTVSPSKTRELAVSDATETNGVVEVANSVAIPDTTNFSLHAISQDVDVNLSKVQDYAIASFQPYLSVSRSSTSPGLLFEAELDDSLASQNLLNSTFNKSEITDEAAVKSIAEISSLVKALAQAEKNEMGISKNTYMFSSPFKINCNTGIKPNYIDSIQVCESDNIVETEQNGLQNMYSSVYDEPQSTSSPRCKKMHTTQRIKRSCLEGDDLMTALDSYTELKPTETLDEVVSDANVLKGASRKSPYSDGDADTEIINPRTPSDSENDTLKNESNTNCSPSNNSQRELCLREDKSYNEASTFVGSLQKDGCDEETAGKENLIKHETDIANVQSVVDSQHVFYPSDDDALEEYVCCELKAAVTNSCYNYVEACPRNEGEDLARPGVSGESLSAFRKLSSVQSWDNGECLSVCAKEENVLNDSFQSCEDTNNKVVQFASPLESGENVECDTKDSTSKDVNTSSVVGLTTDAEAKLPSPTFESPPDSWSHEIVDSGYPNSASGQDITPENDLSSIAQDHIPDTESPSVAEAPRFDVLEPIEVENGDLANNNRDDEGNNMVAAADANDIEGLQPLIDVLENDLENENDIYMVENGFPMWLLNLRIQEVAGDCIFRFFFYRRIIRAFQRRDIQVFFVLSDARYMDHDEGFDSSSSDE